MVGQSDKTLKKTAIRRKDMKADEELVLINQLKKSHEITIK